MDYSKTESKIKLALTIIVIFAILYILQKYFHVFWKPKEKTTSEKIQDTENKLNKNVKKTAKSFVDTKKMTIKKSDFDKHYKTFVKAWELGQIDLLMNYLDKINNPYDFGYLIERLTKNKINIYKYPDSWSSEKKGIFDKFIEIRIIPRIKPFVEKIQDDLGEYGNELVKIIFI